MLVYQCSVQPFEYLRSAHTIATAVVVDMAAVIVVVAVKGVKGVSRGYI